MININELTIGAYVMHNKKICSILKIDAYFEEVTILTDDIKNEFISCNLTECEPIQITDELLEELKVQIGTMYESGIKLYIIFHEKIKPIQLIEPVKYIHQLQGIFNMFGVALNKDYIYNN